MRFSPHTPSDIARMLEVIGVRSVDDLFASVPASLRDTAVLDLPAGLGEREVQEALARLAERNRLLPSFQGAGCYPHFVPAAVAALMTRSEFATAYTPYQPEVSQGTLQACFEFQSYVAMLTGLDVANASMYDGASALAEAVLMALRLQPKRTRVLLSAGVHPEYAAVVRTYLDGYGNGHIETVPLAADGRTDTAALERMIDGDVAVVCTGYPNFFGVIDDLGNVSRLAKRAGALSVSVTAEALALALLRAPAQCGADIAVAEGQSFGLPASYGGPGVGLFAARRAFVRQMPGRLVGKTVDEEGRPGYVLTLATREQHIRREKATSNICTNHGLAALAATVFLGLAGKRGLRALAERNAVRAHQAADKLGERSGLRPVFTAPFFNEFVLDVPASASWFQRTVDAGLVPGVPLAELLPEEPKAQNWVLVTVTEVHSDEEIAQLAELLPQRKAA